MSLAFALPTPMPARRKPGRPPGATVPRERRIRILAGLLSGVLIGKEAAGQLGCSRRMLYYWLADLIGDMQPDTDGLRRLADSRRN